MTSAVSSTSLPITRAQARSSEHMSHPAFTNDQEGPWTCAFKGIVTCGRNLDFLDDVGLLHLHHLQHVRETPLQGILTALKRDKTCFFCHKFLGDLCDNQNRWTEHYTTHFPDGKNLQPIRCNFDASRALWQMGVLSQNDYRTYNCKPVHELTDAEDTVTTVTTKHPRQKEAM